MATRITFMPQGVQEGICPKPHSPLLLLSKAKPSWDGWWPARRGPIAASI